MRRRPLAFALLAAFAVFIIVPAVAIVSRGMDEKIFPADVCLVIGSGLAHSGAVLPRLAARLDRAVELRDAGMFRTIIASGEGSVADAMEAYLASKGVPPGNIIPYREGENTRSSAEFCARYLEREGRSSVLVVTHFYHVPRTVMALRACGVSTIGSSYPRYNDIMDIFSTLREIPAFFAYSLGLK